MVHANKTIGFVGFDIYRLSFLIIGSIILVLIWNFLAPLIIISALTYMVYRFSRLALGGFSCAHCYFHFLLSLFLFIFSFGALSDGSFILPLIFLWFSGLTKGVTK